jgi:hypothetical protein
LRVSHITCLWIGQDYLYMSRWLVLAGWWPIYPRN